jgi:C1A family cysteine protease
MFRTAVAAAVVATTVATNVRPREHYEALFFEHMSKFNLKFANGEEFSKRLQIFANNFDQIEEHNSKGLSYTLGVNQFTHMTFDEFKDAVHVGGTRAPFKNARTGQKVHTAPADVSALPASVDWVAAGAVTPVKNQGQCGSCWSFSTTGSLEGAYEIKYGNLQSFSEQELVSCDTTDAGCNGGWMDDAFAWTQKNGGLTTEAAYPYTSGTTGASGTCKTSGYTNNANVAPTGWVDVAPGSVDALMSAVALTPVSVAIQANQAAFQSYSGGVLTGRCGQNLDHGVLATGYGTLNGVDYWQVKNSWGSSWGLDGYILIARNSEDLCGILDAASYPTL